MIAFLAGCAISLVAGVPALLLMRGGQEADFPVRLKLWSIGAVIRFAIIGAAVYYLFTQTDIPRIPLLLGVVVTYFVIFVFESRKTFRS